MTQPLHRLRRLLGLVAALTAVLIAAVCRLETMGRAIAAIGVAACLVAWLALLEAEARAAERLEARSHRRGAAAIAALVFAFVVRCPQAAARGLIDRTDCRLAFGPRIAG
ncbi:MAG TPA: hypothetical protein VIG54_09705 [Lysobacter sp.]